MKNKFRGYYRPSTRELQKLWEDCIFVFDANVLLNLYFYSNDTTNEFLKLIEQIKERTWIPYQAAYEYQKNRRGKIEEQKDVYKNFIDEVGTSHKEIKEKLLQKKHPHIDDVDNMVKDLDRVFAKIMKQLEEKKKDVEKLLKADFIWKKLTSLFKGKTGEPFDDEKTEDIIKKGKKRYEFEIPPGYKDTNKKQNQFGDLILWFQMIDKLSNEKKSAIFVTDDRKEDWWRKDKSGETVGPRPELIEEIFKETGERFYMYSLDKFMEYIQKHLNKEVNKTAIEEVKDLRERVEESAIAMENVIKDTGISVPLSVLKGIDAGIVPLSTLGSTFKDLNAGISVPLSTLASLTQVSPNQFLLPNLASSIESLKEKLTDVNSVILGNINKEQRDEGDKIDKETDSDDD